jgi:hypothetical protein
MNYIKNQWIALFAIIFWILISGYVVNSVFFSKEKLQKETAKLKFKIDSLDNINLYTKKQIQIITKQDTLYVQKIKTIKEKEYVEIKIVDSMPISGLQSYFTERYP